MMWNCFGQGRLNVGKGRKRKCLSKGPNFQRACEGSDVRYIVQNVLCLWKLCHFSAWSVRLKHFVKFSSNSCSLSHSYIMCFTETVVHWWYRDSALSAMSVGRSALLTYNAALNKPAYQSSVYVGRYGSHNASLANDGSRGTSHSKYNKPQCSISQPETNPWWAVDLGRPTTIYGVDLTNRGDSGMYLFCLELWTLEFLRLTLQWLFRSVHSVHGWGVRCHSFLRWRLCQSLLCWWNFWEETFAASEWCACGVI